MTTTVTIDLAGGQLGGAARYRIELSSYLDRHARHDIKVIGTTPAAQPGLASDEGSERGAAQPPGRAEQRRIPDPRR